MKTNVKLILGMVFVVIVGLLIYFTSTESPTIETPPVVVTEDSILGCYVSKLVKDIYVLRIESETNGIVSGKLAFNNYEKDSSSGSFTGTYTNGILLGDYSFNSEGTQSEMQVIFKKDGQNFVRGYGSVKNEGEKVTFENLNTISYDTNSTFVRSTDCIELFTEVNNKFTFEYNSFLKVYERNQEQNLPSTDWRLNAKQKGVELAHVIIPKTYMPGTNFSSAYLTMGASTDPKEIKSCSTGTATGEIKDGTRTISGYPFTRFSFSEAGAGNFYETISYRGLLDGDCYVLEYTIHSTNIGNYSADQGIKEFDEVKIQNEFESIIDSFKFLVNSD